MGFKFVSDNMVFIINYEGNMNINKIVIFSTLFLLSIMLLLALDFATKHQNTAFICYNNQ
jgi:hypothetical protein